MERKAKNAAIGSILMSTASIGAYASVPVFLVPLSKALNVGIGEVALLFTVAAISSLITSLNLGTLLKKIKLRLLVILSGILLASFFIIIYLANSIMLIYLGAFIFGFSTVLGGFAGSQTEVTWWFAKDRGKIMSYLSIGVGIYGLVFISIYAKLIASYGYQTVALLIGLITGAILIFTGLFLISEHPSKYGLKPYGYVEAQNTSNASTAKVPDTGTELTVKQIIGTAPFWMIIIAVILVSVALTGFTNNASAFYQTRGLDAVNAALMISINSAVKLGWSPIYGALVDKKGPGFATAICGLTGAAILVAAVFLNGFVGSVIIAVLLGSLSFTGMLGAISLTMVFGGKEAGTLIGYANAAASVGAMIGAPLAGFIFDGTGSYIPYLFIASAMCVLTVILTLSATSEKTIQKIKEKETQLANVI